MMELKIKDVEKQDFGTYKCIAKNPRGQTDGQITLTGNFCTSSFFLYCASIKSIVFRAPEALHKITDKKRMPLLKTQRNAHLLE